MDMRQFSKDQLKKASDKLNEVQKRQDCCAQPNKTILDEASVLLGSSNDSSPVAMEMVTVICESCGLVEQHDAKVIGISTDHR